MTSRALRFAGLTLSLPLLACASAGSAGPDPASAGVVVAERLELDLPLIDDNSADLLSLAMPAGGRISTTEASRITVIWLDEAESAPVDDAGDTVAAALFVMAELADVMLAAQQPPQAPPAPAPAASARKPAVHHLPARPATDDDGNPEARTRRRR